MFEKACELDTNFAVAYAWQAKVYMTLYLYTSYKNRDIYLRKYENSISKAEAAAPEIPEINYARAVYFSIVKQDYDAALKEMEIANFKRPNDYDFLGDLAGFNWILGNKEKALEIAIKRYELDPKGIEPAYAVSGILFEQERYSESERWKDIMINNSPENALGYAEKLDIIINVFGDLKRAEDVLEAAKKIATMEKFRLNEYEYLIYFYKRDYNQALKLSDKIEYAWYDESYRKYLIKARLLKLLSRDKEAKVYFDSLRIICVNFLKDRPNSIGGNRTMNLAIAYAGLDDRAKALKEITKMKSDFMESAVLGTVQLYILLGDNESAIKSLEKGVNERGYPRLGELKLDPMYDPLRSDPIYKKIIAVAEERIKKAQR
jgi:hypothetical protein